MKRREAVRNIVIFSLGTGVLYSCTDPYQAIKNLNLSRLNFNTDHLRILDKLSRSILPIQQIPELANHTALPFIMKQVNDLQNEKSQEQFQQGYKYFNDYFKEKTNLGFLEADATIITSFLEKLNTLEISIDQPESPALYIHNLYHTLKQENLFYLKTTEYFQKKYRFYEMAPGRFDGNFSIADLNVDEE